MGWPEDAILRTAWRLNNMLGKALFGWATTGLRNDHRLPFYERGKGLLQGRSGHPANSWERL